MFKSLILYYNQKCCSLLDRRHFYFLVIWYPLYTYIFFYEINNCNYYRTKMHQTRWLLIRMLHFWHEHLNCTRTAIQIIFFHNLFFYYYSQFYFNTFTFLLAAIFVYIFFPYLQSFPLVYDPFNRTFVRLSLMFTNFLVLHSSFERKSKL